MPIAFMSTPESPKKPQPSLEEIQAYLEESAARTKKRLPLAATPKPKAEPEVAPRALPLTSKTDVKDDKG